MAADDLFGDVEWLPHRVDPVAGEVGFVRLTRADHRRMPFLSDQYVPAEAERRTLPIATAVAGGAQLAPGRLHFIFHSAFCCSTLLARALDVEGRVMALKEPDALTDLAAAAPRVRDPARFRAAADAMARLLARPFSAGEVVVAKPTNVVNPIAELLLSVQPGARALLVHAPLPAFLRSVAMKGLWGRVWARKSAAAIAWKPAFDPGWSEAERWQHTDLQVAALGWLQQQAQFARLIAGQSPGRVASASSEALLADPAATMAALSRFFALDLAPAEIAAAAKGSAFSSDAKKHRDRFDAGERAERHRLAEAAHGEEIAMVVRWAEAVAAHAGVPMTLGRPLLG